MLEVPSANVDAEKEKPELDGQLKSFLTSMAIASFDSSGIILSANRKFLDLFGYTLLEVIGKHHGLFVEPAERESADYRRFCADLRDGQIEPWDCRRLAKDGREICLRTSYLPIWASDGRPTKIFEFAFEIPFGSSGYSGRAKPAQFQSLPDSPAHTKMRLFESTVINALDAVLITEAEPVDSPGPRIVYVNPSFTSISGYSAEEVIGRTPRMLQGPLTSSATREKIRTALNAWQPVETEILNYHKDGTVFWVELSISPLTDENGWYTNWISVQRDITGRKRLEEELRLTAERLSLAADAGQTGIMEFDVKNKCLLLNEWARSIFGVEHFAEGWFPVRSLKYRVHPDDIERCLQAVQKALVCMPFSLEFRIVLDDGDIRHLSAAVTVTRDAAGHALRMIGAVQNITARIQAEIVLEAEIVRTRRLTEALSAQKEFLEVTLKSIGDAVICTDRKGLVNFSNIVAEQLLGVSAGEAHGSSHHEIARMIEASCDHGRKLPADFTLIRSDGSSVAVEGCVAPIFDRDHNEAGKVIVFRDVSAARAIAAKMRHSAYHDALTGLPNRQLLDDRLNQVIEIASLHNRNIAVLYLDLDGFKQINDLLGHQTGDEILKSVGTRLLECLRQSDTVSRQGGDEFVVLLTEINDLVEAQQTAQRLLQAVNESHMIDGCELSVTASIGISLYPQDGLDAATLMKAADTDMYKAKMCRRLGL